MNSSTFRSLFAFSLFSFPSKKKLWQCGIVLSLAFIVIPTFALRIVHRSHAASTKRQSLTFEDRVAAQRAIEEVYWRHRLWPKENPQPKPPLEQVMPDEAIREKVEDYLRKSTALEIYWQRPVTSEQLQAEMERMARNTKQPEVLRELWAALGNDPLLIAESLVRPVLAERLLCNWYATDERFHGALKRRAETELNAPDAFAQRQALSGKYHEMEWQLADSSDVRSTANGSQHLDAEQWRAQMNRFRQIFGSTGDGVQSTAFGRDGLASKQPPEGDTLNAVALTPLPAGRLSALQEDEERFFGLVVLEQTATRVKIGSVEWRKLSFEEWWNEVHAKMSIEAVGLKGEYQLSEIVEQSNGCFTETWSATMVGTPDPRFGHTAVWTGTEMIIWGGGVAGTRLNTGGRYNPATDTWAAISMINAPSARGSHTAVWTGKEMIVWGGDASVTRLNTGGRYNPTTDTWTATNTINASSARTEHTAVWAGTEMIVWGGLDYDSSRTTLFNTGGRYNPATDTWSATSTINAPSARSGHTSVWTGAEMIVWGGGNILNTGGRYNPAVDSWTPTSTTNSPSARFSHSSVWTGTEMVIWGGRKGFEVTDHFITGGRYNPTTDAWTATSIVNTPSARGGHTTIWTGREMIVWGGFVSVTRLNTGGRYNPATDTWSSTSMIGVPSERDGHTVVWTGTEMIIWGGENGPEVRTGGRYSPATDTWASTNATGAPAPRGFHTAVWTGIEMVVWGGFNSRGYFNTGGRYNPTTDDWVGLLQSRFW